MRNRTKACLALLVTALAVLGGCTSKHLPTPKTMGDFGREKVLDAGENLKSLSWSPDGRLLAATSQEGRLRIWNTTTYQLQMNRSGSIDSLMLPAWSPDGGSIALSNIDPRASKEAIIRNTSTDAPAVLINESVDSSLGEGIVSLSWSPDGGRLAVGLNTGRALILNTSDWTRDRVLGVYNSFDSEYNPMLVSWSPNGTWLASISRNNLKIWDAGDWSVFQNLSVPRAIQMTWSSDGSSIGLVNISAVWIVSASNWSLFRAIPLPSSHGGSVTLSPANLSQAAYFGRSISGYKGSPVEVLNLTTGIVERRLLVGTGVGFSGYVDPAWSPDGRRLAVAYTNGKVILWSHDDDRDMYADLVDRFPEDHTQWNDTDRDGYGDDPNGHNPDIFPNDPHEWMDTDKDGMGDNRDPLPTVHNALFVALVVIIIVVIIAMVLHARRRRKRAFGGCSTRGGWDIHGGASTMRRLPKRK